MNRWTGTAYLTKDPQLIETDSGMAICNMRIAVGNAGRNGNPGYFDAKCFEAQARACAKYLKAGREVAIDGRLFQDEYQVSEDEHAWRIYLIADRVEFLNSRRASNGSGEQSQQTQPAPVGGAAREDSSS